MKHIGTRTLKTQRLILRAFKRRDAKQVYRSWASDAQVTRYLRWQCHESEAQTKALMKQWVKNYRHKDHYHWAIVRRSDKVLMGALGIMPSTQPHGPNGYEPGYCLGAEFWGKGYATEALSAALDYFIGGTGASTLYCCHATQNEASGRVMRKAGFVFSHEGSYPRYDGAEIPALFYTLSAEDYASRNTDKIAILRKF